MTVAKELGAQLSAWLEKAKDTKHTPARAIISPHAGYSYCGPCAGYAYGQIDPSKATRVFILGPSHHEYLLGCALSQLASYSTPLGSLVIDRQTCDDLAATKKFKVMSKEVDEAEHSIEMQLPYIAKVFEGRDVSIVPVLVGEINAANASVYGAIFGPYLANVENVFVISSDFCHWGKRFRFQHTDPSCLHIHEGIEKLDRQVSPLSMKHACEHCSLCAGDGVD